MSETVKVFSNSSINAGPINPTTREFIGERMPCPACGYQGKGAHLCGQPKSETQQILEAIAALADGLRSRDIQLYSIGQAVGKLDQKLAALADGLRARDAQLTSISEQVGISNRNSAGNGLQLLDLGKRLEAIEEKLGKIRCGNRIGQSKTFCDQTLGHRGFCSAFVVARRKKKGKR